MSECFVATRRTYKEVDCSIESFLTRDVPARKIKEDKFIDHRRFLCESNWRPGIESAVKSPRRGEGGCIRPRLCAADKQIRRVHGRHSMYKAGAVRRVNNGRREKKTRAFGRQTRAVFKRGLAIYGADLFARALCGNKGRGRSRAENRFDMRSMQSRRE